MLVSSKQMILEAKKGGYAIGCFNTSDLEITKAIIAAAESENSPIIISTSEKAIEYAGLETLSMIIIEEARRSKIPIALHLDHGQTLQTVEKCIRAGYTSIMFDGSKKALEENELMTRHAVELAHHAGLPCEGELGHLGKAGINQSDLTDPADVTGYIERTGVDFLAVSIGSQHGSLGSGSEKLNLGLLSEIKKLTQVPLVLHGASGVAEEDVRQAIKAGISKINIDTDIRQTFTSALKRVFEQEPQASDPRDVLTEAMSAVRDLVKNKISLFGSAGKVQNDF